MNGYAGQGDPQLIQILYGRVMRKLKALIAASILAFGTVVAVAPTAEASVTIAIFYTDWHWQGWSTGIAGGADCDYSGYHLSFGHNSTLGQTSSVGTYYNAPHCNRAKFYTTYGGQGVCNLPCYYVGDWANDQIIAADIYRGAGT